MVGWCAAGQRSGGEVDWSVWLGVGSWGAATIMLHARFTERTNERTEKTVCVHSGGAGQLRLRLASPGVLAQHLPWLLLQDSVYGPRYAQTQSTRIVRHVSLVN